MATLLSLDPEIVTRRGRYPATVKARSVLCCWAARELGISTLELSKRLGISQPTASQSVKRGEKIIRKKGTQAKGMTYANISIPVPYIPSPIFREASRFSNTVETPGTASTSTLPASSAHFYARNLQSQHLVPRSSLTHKPKPTITRT